MRPLTLCRRLLGLFVALPAAALPCAPGSEQGPPSDLSLLSALYVLAEESGYRLVTSPELVRGERVASRMDCGPLEVRARRLLQPRGLDYRVIGDTLVVFRARVAGAEEETPSVPPARPSVSISEVVVEGSSYGVQVSRGEGNRYGSYAGGADAALDFDRIHALGITDLASALELISGVKMEQERYAVIRGMKGRYQSVRLNGAVIPSLEPAGQRVPMDVFPVNILNQVDLRKSVFADAPGNASAGVINIETRRIPEKSSLTLVSGGGYRSGTTGKTVMRGYTGDRDWLGYDDGGRKLPRAIADSARLGDADTWPEAQREAAGEAIPRNYGLYYGEAGADGLLNLSGGHHWQRGQHSWGISASLGYQNTWQQLDLYSQVLQRQAKEPENDSGNDSGDDSGDKEKRETFLSTEDFSHQRLDNVINASGLLALGYGLGERHYLGGNFLVLRQSVNRSERIETRERNFFGEFDGEGSLRSLSNWTEKQMALGQIYGSHYLGAEESTALNWHLTSARSRYYRPYDVRYRYYRNDYSSPYIFDTNAGAFEVSWEDMREETLSAGLNASYQWFWEDFSGELKAGIEGLDARQDGYLLGYTFRRAKGAGTIEGGQELAQRNNPADILTPENIVGAPGFGGFLLDNAFVWTLNPPELDGDFYAAEHRNRADYLLVDNRLGERWQFLLGVRRERDSVKADFWDVQPGDWVQLLHDGRNLHSAALGFTPSERHELRLGYSETVVWPGVNELMPRRYEDAELRIELTGNPNLEPASAENWDLRWQFSNDGQGLDVKLLGFYKNIDRAIEGVFFDPVVTSNRAFNIYSYTNTDSATLYGYELELDYRRVFGDSHKLELKSSYAGMDSEVTLPPRHQRAAENRPLQGQPDYLGSLQLQYRHLDSDRGVSLLYKRSGEELYIVSNTYDVPDVYREPEESLSLVFNTPLFGGVHGTFSVENLLDSNRHYVQGGQTFLEYRQGRKYQFRVAVDF